MNDFLGRLAQRALAPAPAVRPRLASLFEPMPAAASTAPEELVSPPAAESPFARPAKTGSVGAPGNGHDESGPSEKAISLQPTMLSIGSEPAPPANPVALPADAPGFRQNPNSEGAVATANLLPLSARHERGEGNSKQKRPSSPRPSPPPAGGEGEKTDRPPQPSLNSAAVGCPPVPDGDSPLGKGKAHELFPASIASASVAPVPSDQRSDGTGGSPVLPIPTSAFRLNRPASPQTGERDKQSRPESAAPARDDSPPADASAQPVPTVRARPPNQIALPADTRTVPQNRPPSPQTGDGREQPRPEAAAPGREDSRPAGQPEPVAVPRRAESRVIRPQIKLPSAATFAVDAGRHTPEAAAPPISSTPPDVRITIGRVEIRAVTPPAPPRANGRPAPRLSLDDYLKQTAGGRR